VPCGVQWCFEIVKDMSIVHILDTVSSIYVRLVPSAQSDSVDVSTQQVNMKIASRLSTHYFYSILLVNTTVLPPRSRCASQPCQNGGTCLDFPVVDAFYCGCRWPYQGVRCQEYKVSCPSTNCGMKRPDLTPNCIAFPSDRALISICQCTIINGTEVTTKYSSTICGDEKSYLPNCLQTGQRLGTLPFTNKGFYICHPGSNNIEVMSCLKGRIWDDITWFEQ
jgi:hypothetical protein